MSRKKKKEKKRVRSIASLVLLRDILFWSLYSVDLAFTDLINAQRHV